ncbi:MAG: hypothetical protein K2H13_08435 [Eubacterium sp.]|nr:hypothetical protein [Eubacterium sp.]MDE6155578.1 hypothetical protein [Eubacterium sp.]MDE6767161.1 hypothetical protein [Eubacterium sp.]
MKKEEYIENVLKHIHNKAFLNTIRNEIENHIDERKQYYLDIGYDAQTSQQKAVEHMGSADELGFQMDILHDYKKNKIICATGLIIFVINLITVSLISKILYLDFIMQSGIIIALFTSYFVYRFALVSRCRVILFLQGLVSISAAIYFTTGIDIIWIFGAVSFKEILNSNMPFTLITLAAGFIFLVNSIICLTCSGEIKALIQGSPNTKILDRYKRYEYFLLICAVIIAILSITLLIYTDSFVFLYSIGQG